MTESSDLTCTGTRVTNGKEPLAKVNDNDYHLYCSDRFLSRAHDSPVLRAQPRIIDRGMGRHGTPCQARWRPFSPASQTSDPWLAGIFSLDEIAMDELKRFRNAALAVAAAAVTFWLINDWAQTQEILTNPSRWLHRLMAPRPD